MKEFNRMNKEAWKAFSRTIRINRDKSAYACGQLFDAHQWLAIYAGIKGCGIEVLPLYEHKDGYIHCCRILYQLADNAQQRKQYMQDAKEWASKKA